MEIHEIRCEDDCSMQPIGSLIKAAFDKMGSELHRAPEKGEFIDDDGFVVCEKCGVRKEKLLFNGHIVPCLCRCGTEARDREEAERRISAERARVAELAGCSLMDDRARSASFEAAIVNDANRTAFKIARRYVERWDDMLHSNTGILFYGDTGTGKTFLADCIANALLDRGVPVLVTSIIQLTSGGFDAENELKSTLNRMRSARLVVLDDLGAERTSDYKAEQVFSVIDSRYNSGKPLVVTTNLSPREMRNTTDLKQRRIFERVLENCVPVQVAGQNHRSNRTVEQIARIRNLLDGVD